MTESIHWWGILYIVISYLIGSIPTGVWYSKLRYRIDVRSLGSGNSGGTNVGRNFGFFAGVIVIAVDVLKGWIPTLLAQYLFPGQDWIVMLTGMATVFGHAYPIWADFRGGKVVATSIGVFLGFDFPLALFQVLLLVIFLFLTSTVSLSAMLSYGIGVILIYVFHPEPIYRIGFTLIFFFMVYRHRENIKRLMNGEESRISWGLRSKKHS